MWGLKGRVPAELWPPSAERQRLDGVVIGMRPVDESKLWQRAVRQGEFFQESKVEV